MKANRILILLLSLIALLPAKADNITVDGTSRSYIVYAPKNLGENRPLFIFCHGAGQDANYMLNTQFRDTQNPERKISIEAVCDTAKFVILFPNGINNQWDISGDRDINLVKALIDKMVTQHKIDRNRVYLGGFSMGGMFTYHAMNRIPDLIAAFVPVSGYPMGGATANADVRPLPILHIHGTGDDVCGFSGVQPALNVWIRHNGCPTKANVVNNYNGFNAKMHSWGPGNDGVYVKLMELANKGHWVCKEPQVYTGKEMWNFCKNYSLDMKDPSVKITSPAGNLTFVALGGAAHTGTIRIEATASDPDGQIVSVKLYDGEALLGERKSNFESLAFDVPSLASGIHNLRVVATDDDQRTGVASFTVEVIEQTGNYVFTKIFDTEGSVPHGWVTFDGNEQRIGYSDGYTQGCRVFHFTAEERDFEWGLYARNVGGRPGEGYARFASPLTTTTLYLHTGNYQLLHRLANWNIATFSPVQIVIEKTDGTPVYEQTFTPTVNIGNDPANAFKGATLDRFNFDIAEAGPYQISFYTADAAWADLVVGQAAIGYKGVPVGIQEASTPASRIGADATYDLQGRRIGSARLSKGIYIRDGKKFVP